MSSKTPGRRAGGGPHTPLAELMDSDEERQQVEKLTAEAAAAPAMARLREIAAFVGRGRPATEAGNLKLADTRELARSLGASDEVLEHIRGIDDLPDVARLFHWAVASGVLTARRSTIIPGPLAADLERDPLAVWITAAVTLLEHGLLSGFRQGWRKIYVELLDQSVGGLLVGLVEAGTVPRTAIEEQGWRLVADGYGYEPDDAAERRYVAKLVRNLLSELAVLGIVTLSNKKAAQVDVTLTALGGTLATIAALSLDDPDDPE